MKWRVPDQEVGTKEDLRDRLCEKTVKHVNELGGCLFYHTRWKKLVKEG